MLPRSVHEDGPHNKLICIAKSASDNGKEDSNYADKPESDSSKEKRSSDVEHEDVLHKYEDIYIGSRIT